MPQLLPPRSASAQPYQTSRFIAVNDEQNGFQCDGGLDRVPCSRVHLQLCSPEARAITASNHVEHGRGFYLCFPVRKKRNVHLFKRIFHCFSSLPSETLSMCSVLSFTFKLKGRWKGVVHFETKKKRKKAKRNGKV